MDSEKVSARTLTKKYTERSAFVPFKLTRALGVAQPLLAGKKSRRDLVISAQYGPFATTLYRLDPEFAICPGRNLHLLQDRPPGGPLKDRR